jgi:transcriptional regulator with XRE-family HTH domain
MNLGERLRLARKRKRITQAELAALSGTSRQAIGLLEKGRGRVSTLLSVDEHLRVHVSRLALGESLAERLKATRLRNGVSLSEAADRAGVAINTVRAIEAGGGNVEALSRLIRALEPQAAISFGEGYSKRKGFITVGRRATRERNPLDHYPTPAPIVRLLLDHEEFTREGSILEPAVGKLRVIERVLRERGYANVVCFDLDGLGAERRDFLDVTEQYHSVVTNPPYSLHREFVQHAKRIATHKIAMLLPLNNLTGAARHAELWSDTEFPLARMWVLSRGIDFIRSDPMGDTFHPSQMYCAWMIFEREHEGPPAIHWINSDALIARRKKVTSAA